jgi:hypothetical protein
MTGAGMFRIAMSKDAWKRLPTNEKMAKLVRM